MLPLSPQTLPIQNSSRNRERGDKLIKINITITKSREKICVETTFLVYAADPTYCSLYVRWCSASILTGQSSLPGRITQNLLYGGSC